MSLVYLSLSLQVLWCSVFCSRGINYRQLHSKTIYTSIEHPTGIIIVTFLGRLKGRVLNNFALYH